MDKVLIGANCGEIVADTDKAPVSSKNYRSSYHPGRVNSRGKRSAEVEVEAK